MPEAVILDTIDAVSAEEWDRLAISGIERHAYLRAVDRSGLAGFEWRYILVRDAGRLLAAAPAFVTDYALETTVGEHHARQAATLRRLFPRLMTQRVAALGSPCTETAMIGFAPDLPADRRRAAGGALLDGLDRIARDAGATLVAAKDLAAADLAAMGSLLDERGYGRMPSLPIASLDIDFGSVDAYLARLSPGTRRDMRRKLRATAQVRVERVRDLAPVMDRVMTLYAQTRARADMTFEMLTPAYFSGTLNEMDARAFATLYWQGDDLAAFNLLLEDDGVLLDKFFCMDAALGRPLNLYFLSWFENIAYCLDRNLVRYQVGQAGYANKLRFGCGLEPTTIWFRHRSALLNRVLGAAVPYLAPAVDDDVSA